ncbi:hypothetical protein DPMN_009606 [Dreissena polymorpha]|uniref:Uncharacterized protein n=1 Tax=Dreissena polymorpha TaxID=45954 RepID=A0A9D4N0R8_DREPO|nr:hypothetical protein DPMN_009606 [Dreissena polymorpha]
METFAPSSLHRLSTISSVDSPASEADSGIPEILRLFLRLYCSASIRSFSSSETRSFNSLFSLRRISFVSSTRVILVLRLETTPSTMESIIPLRMGSMFAVTDCFTALDMVSTSSLSIGASSGIVSMVYWYSSAIESLSMRFLFWSPTVSGVERTEQLLFVDVVVGVDVFIAKE